MLVKFAIIVYEVLEDDIHVICLWEVRGVFEIINCHIPKFFSGSSRFGQEILMVFACQLYPLGCGGLFAGCHVFGFGPVVGFGVFC
jgi:hypothetical protein